jgi:hypothetical protein
MHRLFWPIAFAVALATSGCVLHRGGPAPDADPPDDVAAGTPPGAPDAGP